MKLIRTPKEYSEFVQETVAGNKHAWSHGGKLDVEHDIKWAYDGWGKPKKYPCVGSSHIETIRNYDYEDDHETIIDLYYEKDIHKMLNESQKDVNKYQDLLDKLNAS